MTITHSLALPQNLMSDLDSIFGHVQIETTYLDRIFKLIQINLTYLVFWGIIDKLKLKLLTLESVIGYHRHVHNEVTYLESGFGCHR